MNIGLYDVIVRWSEMTGCTMDEALAIVALVWFIFFVLLGWAFGFTFDLGLTLYDGMKKLLRFIIRRIRSREKVEP